MRVFFAVVLPSLAACSRPAAVPTPVPVATAPPGVVERADPGVSSAEADGLRTEVRELRQALNAAQLAQADARGEVERYQSGLARCVDELNRVASAQQTAARYVPSAPAAPAAQPRLSTLGAPDVQIVGDNVYVTGRVWNSGDADARGRLYVELLRDGQVLDSSILPLDVPARTDQSYSATFRPLIANGTYSARVRFEL